MHEASARTTTTPGAGLGRFFVLAYAISWGGVALASLAGEARMPAMLLAMLAGPPLAALLATPPGERRRLLTTGWGGAGWRWYVLAFALTPVALLAVLLPLSLADPAFLPAFRPGLMLFGLAAGLCEEVGWTGYATPRMLTRGTVTRAGLGLGLIWSCWHLAADFAGNVAAMGALWPVQFAVFWVLALVPYRLVMTRVFAATRARALAVAMHAGFTGWLLALTPALDPSHALAWQAPFAALMWALALAGPRIRP